MVASTWSDSVSGDPAASSSASSRVPTKHERFGPGICIGPFPSRISFASTRVPETACSCIQSAVCSGRSSPTSMAPK